jgi:cyclopropane fatty-acyl-phospholipid synthase-like methyltransferase
MDLGCGKAITTIFLVQEFRLQVWATDLWVSAALPHQNLTRGFAQLVVSPLRL